MTEKRAEYKAMPKCKLCGSEPASYDTKNEAGIKHHCVNDECTLCLVLFTKDEWRKLMAEQEQEAEQEWIKCSDRLPETVGSYLGSDGIKIYFVFFTSEKKWAFENEFLVLSHWMPLPKLPEQSK